MKAKKLVENNVDIAGSLGAIAYDLNESKEYVAHIAQPSINMLQNINQSFSCVTK